MLTPEVFAQQLVDDFEAAQAPLFTAEIADQIRKQVSEYAMAVEDDPTGLGESRVVDDEEIEHQDIRIVIKVGWVGIGRSIYKFTLYPQLDMNVGAMYLKDQFEWPLFSTQTYLPEDFARLVWDVFVTPCMTSK